MTDQHTNARQLYLRLVALAALADRRGELIWCNVLLETASSVADINREVLREEKPCRNMLTA